MTTAGDVLAWRPDALAAASADIATVSDSLLTQVRRLDSAAEALRDGWQGVAADAAHRRVLRERGTGADLVRALDAVSTALDTGASTLGAARGSLVWIRSDAASRGYTVRDDGSVVPPPVTPVMSSPEQAAAAAAQVEQQRLALISEAERIAGEVGRVVGDAAAADEALAGSLRDVALPADLRTSVEEIRRRHAAGADAWDIVAGLGLVGGAAVTAKALMGAWKAAGKTAALAGYLTNAVRGGLEYGPAMRWLLTGTGDASSFIRAAEAAQKMEAAAQVFQFGKAPGWLVGVRTVAGKAFLPLTVATGAMDAFTGGGYDGARGATTRVLGLAGAAGAGALWVGGAAFLASNPVGWGIAAGAVAVYTAWTAGNFIYDHWDDITNAVGTAANWVGDRAADVGHAAQAAADWAGERLSDAGDALGDAADTMGRWAGGAVSGLGSALGSIF